MIIKENYHIITGGPGVGKTTLINELLKRNFYCVAEVARQIIKNQVEINGTFLPWKDTLGYSRLMFEASMVDFISNYKVSENVFFDRGLPDVLGYDTLMKFKIDKFATTMCEKLKYNKSVFILPPWKEIYENDEERKQDFEEAVKTYEVMKDTYLNLDYNLIEVPCMSVDLRADFILRNIESL